MKYFVEIPLDKIYVSENNKSLTADVFMSIGETLWEILHKGIVFTSDKNSGDEGPELSIEALSKDDQTGLALKVMSQMKHKKNKVG